MGSDQPYQHPEEEWSLVEEIEPKALKPVYFLPFDVQLQNTFCIEIMARRYPVNIENIPHVQVNLEEAQVDVQRSRAQVTLHVRTVANDDSPPFDMRSLKMNECSCA